MPFRRILLYALFAIIPLSLLSDIILAFSAGGENHLSIRYALAIIFLVSELGLVVWSIVFLKIEPKLTRIALVVYLIFLIVFVLLAVMPINSV